MAKQNTTPPDDVIKVRFMRADAENALQVVIDLTGADAKQREQFAAAIEVKLQGWLDDST